MNHLTVLQGTKYDVCSAVLLLEKRRSCLAGDLELKPAGYWQDKISELLHSNAYDQAWALCQQALGRHPRSPALLVSAASVLMKVDQPAEAERYMAQAAALLPDSAVVWNNLGLTLRNQNRIPESLRCFDRAIALDPKFARARYDKAFSLLLSGEFDQGFREYEHRWEANGKPRPGDNDPEMRARLWNGENPAGRRILVYGEQGLGDTIQFVRYSSLLQARGAKVVLEVHPTLRELMRWLRPECEVGSGDGLTAFDVHCPMMTLPLLFRTTPDTIPPPAIFHVPNATRTKWKAKIPFDNRQTVGLVWAGTPENPMDDRRSTHLQTFEKILNDPTLQKAVQYISFQLGTRTAELYASPHLNEVFSLAPELTDATETAAALLCMDLVIAVDTFVAHLAASLGIPVWLMLAFAPDWRWFLDREDSPWYPSIRLFRQTAPGDWPGVVERVRVALLNRENMC